MTVPQPDTRTDQRKAEDERIAEEPHRPPPNIPAGTAVKPVEEHFRKTRRRPVALLGIVENGVVRPLDPDVALPERSRVIIVASDLN
ncbi:MAG TPA: hypothetical protein VKD71_08970 [Gemmataceae bacterium]|nr:hypothetical protein [Gemmataceae bacterium]